MTPHHLVLSPLDKAQAINNDFGTVGASDGLLQPGNINYRGAIAEIGAGQEVARLFFESLGSSNTIVKTMSAYGKGCSNAIYETKTPYISEERLELMFKHDYSLLLTRSLADDEKPKNQTLRYFTFADTVHIYRDGWAGVRVQTSGCSLIPSDHDAIDFLIHFDVLAKDKVAKIQIIGALGVNLVHAGILHASEGAITDEALVSALMDNIEPTDIRIDTIRIRKMRVCVEYAKTAVVKILIHEVERERYGILSRNMCVELVKNSIVHCTCFLRPVEAAVPSHFTIGRDKYLILTRSTCDTDDLALESELLGCAKSALLTDLGAAGIQLPPDSITCAIHVPILGLHPPETQVDQYVYIDRVNEPLKHRQHRVIQTKSAPTDKIANIIDRVTSAGIVALVSGYSASSELIKFLRTKTRLKPVEEQPVKEISIVLRADQFVEFLINIEHRFRDREPLEIVGSILRRKARFYIYPCSYRCLVEGVTRYNNKIGDAFKTDAKEKHRNHPDHRVNVDHLRSNLLLNYGSVVKYMETGAGGGRIHDLNPANDFFLKAPLRPQPEN